MSVYLDTSVLVALLTPDPLSARAAQFLRANQHTFTVSDWAGAEFAAALARRFRMGTVTEIFARGAFSGFDEWVARVANRVETVARDIELASVFVRRLDLGLRAPDALHIAIAKHYNCAMASFDVRLIEAAQKLGLQVWAEQPN